MSVRGVSLYFRSRIVGLGARESKVDRLTGVKAMSAPSIGGGEGLEAEQRTVGLRLSVPKQIAFSVIIVVGLLIAGESITRIWVLYFRTSYERYNAGTGRLELRPNVRYRNSRGQEFRINSKGFVGPEFGDSPAAGIYRIIALGDSCTFATGFWRIGYPFQLERRLNAGRALQRFEVINAGIEGYNSSFALGRIRDELLRYAPKLVIIYIGWNDLMKTDPANAARVDEHAWVAELLDQSYLIRAYKKLLFVNLRPLVFRPTDVGDARGGSRFDGFVPTRYRSNLEEMIRILGMHGVKTLLVTLPTVVQPDMRGEELRRANVFFPYFAGAYGVSQFLSLHRAYNRTIMEVGRQEGAEVVDLAGLFEAITPRTPYFWDTMHPNEKGSALIAEMLFDRIRKLESEGRL
jgi:lysophospholipase L1-like esterase